MTVTLNIQDDEELRAYCKDLVKGQINGITREELREIVAEELDRKMKGLDTKNFENLCLQALRTVISNILYKEYKVNTWGDMWLKPYIDDVLKEVIDGKGSERLILEIAKRLTTAP